MTQPNVNVDINQLLARYEQEIGSLRGQNIRTETIMGQRFNEMSQNYVEALQLLQEVAGGLKNTAGQNQLRKQIEEFIARKASEPQPQPGEAPE